jgi:hypothetical protein
MGFGSSDPGGENEGFGGNESGIGGESGGFGGGEQDFGMGVVDNDTAAAMAASEAVAMAQSDVQATQNNMEAGLASNQGLGSMEVGNMMMDFTGLSNQQQQNAYGQQADNDLARDLAGRSFMDQWDAYNAAKAVGANTSPNVAGAIGSLATGVIDTAAASMPIDPSTISKQFTGRTLGQIGLDKAYGDLSGQIARGEAQTSQTSGTQGALGEGTEDMYTNNPAVKELDKIEEASLISRLSRPSNIIRR